MNDIERFRDLEAENEAKVKELEAKHVAETALNLHRVETTWDLEIKDPK